MKENQKQSIEVKGTVLTAVYPTIKKELSFDYSTFAKEVRDAAEAHGFAQKIGDAASGKTPQEKYEMACRIVESFKSGSWNIGTREVNLETLFEAVAKIMGTTAEEVEKASKKWDEKKRAEKLAEFRAHPQVRLEILEIQKRKAEAAAKDAKPAELSLK